MRKAMPRRLVLAQVPLARFISVPTRHSYSDWLTRVGRPTVDLLVCDKSSRAWWPWSTSAPAGSRSAAMRRHERMTQVLQAAGIRVMHWNAGGASERCGSARPLPRAGRGGRDEVIGPAGKRMLPVPEMVEVLGEGVRWRRRS